MTRSTTARPKAARIHPNSPTAATSVPRTTHEQATGKDYRVKTPKPSRSRAPFEQLRLW